MKNPIKHLAHWGLGLALLLSLCVPVHAGEGDAWQVSGFGTVGVAHDDRQDMATVRDISQRPHNETQTGPSWQLDTRLGMQLEYHINPGTELVGQVVARDRAKADSSSHATPVPQPGSAPGGCGQLGAIRVFFGRAAGHLHLFVP
jgi:hypothetical protein